MFGLLNKLTEDEPEESCRSCARLRELVYYNPETGEEETGWCCTLFSKPSRGEYTITQLHGLNGRCECYAEASNCLHCIYYENGLVDYCDLGNKYNPKIGCRDWRYSDPH